MLMQFIGFLAAFTSTISLVPQIIKVHRTHSVADLSNLMILNFLLTSILWVWYGILTQAVAVYAANIIMTIFALWLMILKFKHA